MSTFDRDNKNRFSYNNHKTVSLESAFLRKKLNNSQYIKNVKSNNTPKVRQESKSISHPTLNDMSKRDYSNTKKVVHDTKMPIKLSETNGLKPSHENSSNVDVGKKFEQYLDKLNKITTQFKTFKEKTQDLTGNLSSLNKNKVLEKNVGYHSYHIDNNESDDQNNMHKDAQNSNTTFAFKDFENYNKELHKKQFKLHETIDIEPVIVNHEIEKNLNIIKDSAVMKKNNDNKITENFENTIETKLNLIVSRFIPYFTTISTELRQLADIIKDNNGYLIKNIEVKLKRVEESILNLTKTTDINSLELENIQEKIKFDELNDLLKTVKNVSVRINNLFLKYEDEKQENFELLAKISKLESTLNNTIKSQSDQLEDKLSKLQNNMFSNNELNKNDLLNKVKDICKIFSNSPDMMTMLEKSISNIRLKQDDLLKNAISIKEQLLNNSKEISSIRDSSREHSKIFELVKDLQKNQKNTVVQNNFNEKIHKDMELIKKNIIKLMQEQKVQKEGDLNKNVLQESNIEDSNSIIENENKLQQFVVNDKGITSTSDQSNNLLVKEKSNIVNDTKYTNENANRLSKYQETITKLKGALDLEGSIDANTIGEEDINKVMESKLSDNFNINSSKNFVVKSNSTNKPTQQTQNENTQKNTQKPSKNVHNSVFVLDNSKFFK